MKPSVAALRMWARSELGRRWRALVALGVLAGITAGLALAAVSGARRTDTAYDRFRQATAAPDAIVFATQVGVFDQDYAAVVRLPEVVDAGTFVLAPVALREPLMFTLAPGDDHLYRTLARPLIREGRLPDPRRPDEIVVNHVAAERNGLHVGEQVTVAASTNIEDIFAGPPPAGGPEVLATVVGIGSSPLELVFGGSEEPGFVPSAGFLAQYPEVPRAPNLVVRLRPGTDVAQFHRRVAEALDMPEVPVRDLSEERKRITHSTDLERTGLLVFAGAVALAGLILVGQALTRTVYATAQAVPTLRAVGLTGPELVAGLVAPLLLTAGVGAIVAVASATAMSGWFPVGLARSLDPDLGVQADWLVVAPGALALAVLVVAAANAAAVRAIRPTVGRPGAPGSATVRAIRKAAPLPVAIGAGLALETRRRDRLPVRPAILGAVAAVLGVVGAFGLVRGIDDAVARPARSGQVWDATVTFEAPEDGTAGVPDSVLDSLRDHRSVDRMAVMRLTPMDVQGAGLPVFTVEPVRGDLSFAVLEGRAPEAPDEVALGPSSATALGKKVGDMIQVGGDGGPSFRIVGTALLPQTAHSSFDQGAWTVPGALGDRAGAATLLVTATSGTSPAALVEELQRQVPDAFVEPPAVPQDVLALRNVRTLPEALAVFLVVLGVAALAHALVTAVRRRRHDLAVLRAMGFKPWQSAACIVWQAMTVAGVGVLVGIPLGIVFGRRSWQWVADSTPLIYRAPVAVAAVVLAVPTAVVLANLLAALPARRAARLPPADDLRSE